MMFAYDFPLLGILWTVLAICLVFTFWIAAFYVLVDVFRSRDLRGVAKAGWLLLIILLPIIGVVVYMVARGEHMAERSPRAGFAGDDPYAQPLA